MKGASSLQPVRSGAASKSAVSLKVVHAPPAQSGQHVTINPSDAARLGVVANDWLSISTNNVHFAFAQPRIGIDVDAGQIAMDGMQRSSAGANLDGSVTIARIEPPPAQSVLLEVVRSGATGGSAPKS